MIDDDKAGESGNTAHRVLATREECRQALRDAFAQAAHARCRELLLCDADYADWPLGERAVLESLSQWAHSHRKLTLLAASFDEITRRHTRFLEWRRQWSHVVECRSLDESDAREAPRLLLAPGLLSVRIFDTKHWRGAVSLDPAQQIHCREQVDALLQRSCEALPVTTLGL